MKWDPRKEFGLVVAAFARGPEHELTLRQVAQRVAGYGSAANAQLYGRLINSFGDYFESLGEYKCRPLWWRIAKDFPSLPLPQELIRRFSAERFRAPVSREGALLKALLDEVEAAKEHTKQASVEVQEWVRSSSSERGVLLWLRLVASEAEIKRGVVARLRRDTVRLAEGKVVLFDRASRLVVVEIAALDLDLKLSLREPDLYLEQDQSHLAKRLHEAVDSLVGKPALCWQVLPTDAEASQRPKPPIARKPLLRGDLLTAIAVLEQLGDSEETLKRLRAQLNDAEDGLDQKEIAQGDLDESQFQALQRVFRQPFTMIWGPPGTGKTHTLAALIVAALERKQRVLALSIANVAVDQLALKVEAACLSASKPVRRVLQNGQVLRFGRASQKAVSTSPFLSHGDAEVEAYREQIGQLWDALDALNAEKGARLEKLEQKALLFAKLERAREGLRQAMSAYLDRAKAVFTTVSMLTGEPLLQQSRFDLVVLDEASMMSAPHLVAACLVDPKRVVIAGDMRQLGPIARARSEAALDWLHSDLFSLCCNPSLEEDPRVAMLQTQRRMAPAIAALINEPFYFGRLRTALPKSSLIGSQVRPRPGAPLAFENVVEGKSERAGLSSRHNKANAAVSARLARWALETRADLRVAIIAPYRAQVRLIQDKLHKRIQDPERLARVQVGTIHAFQGSEADVVIWDLVDTDPNRLGLLYRGEAGQRLTNVAISRAKGKVIILGKLSAFAEAETEVPVLRDIINKYYC